MGGDETDPLGSLMASTTLHTGAATRSLAHSSGLLAIGLELPESTTYSACALAGLVRVGCFDKPRINRYNEEPVVNPFWFCLADKRSWTHMHCW